MALQTFTAGQVLTAAQVTALQTNGFNQTVSTKTADHTLVAADKGTRVEMNAAGATTITVNTSLFNAGDTLFIQNIGAGVCTITAGTATVSTSGSLALAEFQGGTLYFVSAGVAIFYPTSAGGGKILQVVSTTKTDTFTTTSSSFVDVTGLTATITPSIATSKILVMLNGILSHGGANERVDLNLRRGNTNIGQASGGTSAQTLIITGPTEYNDVVCVNFLDSPATTSATTYGVQISTVSGTAFFGRLGVSDRRSSTTITLMEVSA